MGKSGAVIRGGVATLLLLLSPVPESQSQTPFSTPPRLSALPQFVKAPSDNPLNADKENLGRLLFWDPILSGNRDVACASCHHPRSGYAEDRDLSVGVNGAGLGRNRRFQSPNTIPLVKRNSPTMLNVGFNGINQSGEYNPADAPMFWDMRVASLEAQALEPINSFEEMRGDAYREDRAVETVVARLNANAEYRTLFSKAFGADNAVTSANLAKALAAFGRLLLATDSPFDRYMRGDRNAMTAGQIVGMGRFERVGCWEFLFCQLFSVYKMNVL
jgi:cytochrome c peroxidase